MIILCSFMAHFMSVDISMHFTWSFYALYWQILWINVKPQYESSQRNIQCLLRARRALTYNVYCLHSFHIIPYGSWLSVHGGLYMEHVYTCTCRFNFNKYMLFTNICSYPMFYSIFEMIWGRIILINKLHVHCHVNEIIKEIVLLFSKNV